MERETLQAKPPFAFLNQEEKGRLCLIHVKPLKSPQYKILDESILFPLVKLAVSCIRLIGNLSTWRSWFISNGMAGRAELDRGRGLRAKCKSVSKTTWNHHERRQNKSVENAFQSFVSKKTWF